MQDQPFKIGDPVMDAAQGRAMLVVAAPEQTVEQWSDANNYELRDNYSNSKFNPDPHEPVVECVYVSDVRSEPSKTYTFPSSRVVLIDAHHADDGLRIYDRVAVEAVAAVFESMQRYESFEEHDIDAVARHIGLRSDVVEAARELADVERTITAEDGDA